MDIADNIVRVRERIAAACARAGRRPEEVKLVAVSKTVAPERIRQAYEAGLRETGSEEKGREAVYRRTRKLLAETFRIAGSRARL